MKHIYKQNSHRNKADKKDIQTNIFFKGHKQSNYYCISIHMSLCQGLPIKQAQKGSHIHIFWLMNLCITQQWCYNFLSRVWSYCQHTSLMDMLYYNIFTCDTSPRLRFPKCSLQIRAQFDTKVCEIICIVVCWATCRLHT